MKRLFKRFYRLTTIALAFMLVGIFFYLGIYTERTGFVKDVLDPKLKQITLPVLNAFRTQKEVSEVLSLSIAPADMDTITAIRERALLAGVLQEGKDRWFPVALVWQGDSLSGKIRLKGGLSDHFKTDKWSYRIKLDNEQRIMDCATFSIQHPNTRNFNYEWLFHQALKQEGIPAIHYDFIAIELNGKQLGLHAFEEHFSKNWSQKHRQVEGPVMKYDDENRIKAISETPNSANDPSLHPLASWFAAPVDAFQLKKVLRDSAQAAMFQANVDLLEQFRRGDKPASHVFDINSFARLFALADVLGSQHAQDWRNLRFVRQTGKDRLVPIGFDGNTGEPTLHIRALREQRPIDMHVNANDNFYEKLFNDSTFYRAYINQLHAFADPEWVDELLVRNESGIRRTEDLINQEFPRYGFDPMVLTHCADQARVRLEMDPALDVYLEEDGQHLLVANLIGLPIRLTELSTKERTVLLSLPCVNPAPQNAPLDFQRIAVPAELSTFQGSITLTYALCHAEELQAKRVRKVAVKNWTISN